MKQLITTFFLVSLILPQVHPQYTGNGNIDLPPKGPQRTLVYIILGVFFFLVVVGILLCYYFQKIQALFSGPQPQPVPPPPQPIVPPPPVVDIESSIPMQLFSEVVQGPEEPNEMECAICITPFSAEDMVRSIPSCRHAFHTECIDGWLAAGNRSCPVCRQNVEV